MTNREKPINEKGMRQSNVCLEVLFSFLFSLGWGCLGAVALGRAPLKHAFGRHLKILKIFLNFFNILGYLFQKFQNFPSNIFQVIVDKP